MKKSVFVVALLAATSAFAGFSEQMSDASGQSLQGSLTAAGAVVDVSQAGWTAVKSAASKAGELSVAGMEGMVDLMGQGSTAASTFAAKVPGYISSAVDTAAGLVVSVATQSGNFSITLGTEASEATVAAYKSMAASTTQVVVYVSGGQMVEDIDNAGKAVSGAASAATSAVVTLSTDLSGAVVLAITTGPAINNELTQGIN